MKWMEIDQNNRRTGIAVGCRASHGLCSDYLFISCSAVMADVCGCSCRCLIRIRWIIWRRLKLTDQLTLRLFHLLNLMYDMLHMNMPTLLVCNNQSFPWLHVVCFYSQPFISKAVPKW